MRSLAALLLVYFIGLVQCQDDSAAHSEGLLVLPSAEEPLQTTVPFNASGNLVYSPSSSVLGGADFSSFLQAAHKNTKVTGVTLKSGNYTVTPYSVGDAHIKLTCSSDTRTSAFTISLGSGTLLWTVASTGGIVLDTCKSVTLKGSAILTYQWDQYPYAQGTLLNVTQDQVNLTVQIHAAFVPAFERMISQYGGTSNGGMAFDPVTRQLLIYPLGNLNIVIVQDTLQSLGNATYTFAQRNIYDGTLLPGDLITIKQPSDSTGIAVYSSTGCTVRDLTLYSAAGFGFYDGTSTGSNSYINLTLTPDPTPGPDGQLPLGSSIYDGLHSTSAKSGPQIANCTFRNTGDDSMTVHGRFHTVITVNQKNSSIVVGSNNIDPSQLGSGDTISAYAPDGKPVASATVTSISATSIPAGVSPNTVDTVFGGTYADDSFYLLKLSSFPKAFATMPNNSFISVPTHSGAGFSMTGNTISNGRGNGCIGRANNGVIENNVITNMAYYGVFVGPAIGNREGSFSTNVMVKNNSVSGQAAGLVLVSSGDNPYPYSDHSSISFINNLVVGVQTTPMAVTSGSNINITGNTFVDVMCSATYGNTVDYAWQMQDEPIQAADIQGLVLSNNYLIVDSNCNNSQANYQYPVYLVNVTNLSGQHPTIVANHATVTKVSTYQVLQHSTSQEIAHVQPEAAALAPEAGLGVMPTMAPEPADDSGISHPESAHSVSFGGND